MEVRIVLKLDHRHEVLFCLEKKVGDQWVRDERLMTKDKNKIEAYLRKLMLEPSIYSKTSYILDDLVVVNYAKYEVRIENYTSIQSTLQFREILRRIEMISGKLRFREKTPQEKESCRKQEKETKPVAKHSRVKEVKEKKPSFGTKKGKYARSREKRTIISFPTASRVKEVKSASVSLLKSAAIALISTGVIALGASILDDAYKRIQSYETFQTAFAVEAEAPTVVEPMAMSMIENDVVKTKRTAVPGDILPTQSTFFLGESTIKNNYMEPVKPPVMTVVGEEVEKAVITTEKRSSVPSSKDIASDYRNSKASDYLEIPFNEIADIYEIPQDRREDVLQRVDAVSKDYPTRTMALYRVCREEHWNNPLIDKSPLNVTISQEEAFRLIRKYAYVYGIVNEEEIEDMYRIHLLETSHEGHWLYLEKHNFGGVKDDTSNNNEKFVYYHSPEIGAESFVRSYYNMKQRALSHPLYVPSGDLLYDINYLYCEDAAPFYYEGGKRKALAAPEAGYWYEIVESISLDHSVRKV